MIGDDLEFGRVFASTLVVLFVVVNIHLILASRSATIFPKHVLNRLASFGPNVGINVKFPSTARLLVASVNSLTGGANDVKIEVVVIVPHKRNLDIRGLCTLACETSLQFGHGPLSRLTRFEQFFFTSGFNFFKTLGLRCCHVGLAFIFELSCKPSFFSFAFLLAQLGFLLLQEQSRLCLSTATSLFLLPATTGGLFLCLLAVSSLIESSFSRCTVALVGVAQHILNHRQFPIEVLFCLPKAHTRMLTHQALGCHAALDVDGCLSPNENEEQTH